MICQICYQDSNDLSFCKNIDIKGFSSHLRSAHHITNKEYYDKFLKKPNEDICPICGKTNKFISIVKGYSKHCSTKCSSLDPIVQHKTEETLMIRYNVKYPAQLESNKTATHSELAKNKRKATMQSKYGCISSLKFFGVREKIKQTMQSKYNCENPYSIPKIKEKALNNANTIEAKIKRHNTKKQNGWTNTKLEIDFIEQLNSSHIEFLHDYKSEQYPWKVDFYLPTKNLYIEINNFWTHCDHFYNKNSEDDKLYKEHLEQKSKEINFYKTNLYTWTISDIKKRDWAITHSLNYVVLWNKEQINMFFEDLYHDKQFLGFIDYNNK